MTQFIFKNLSSDDLTLIEKWFKEPFVKKWYLHNQEWNRLEIEKKYHPNINGEKAIHGFIIMGDNKSIGYIQYYLLNTSLPDGVLNYRDPLFLEYDPYESCGIDIFLSDAYQGQGKGPIIINEFIQSVLPKYSKAILIDPIKTNSVAIKAYQKSGFSFYREIFDKNQNEFIYLMIKLIEKDYEIKKRLKIKAYFLSNTDEITVYSVIKNKLSKVFFNDPSSYLEGKASFIQNIAYKAGVASEEQLNASDNIKIEPYNPKWKKYAIAEIETLKAILPSDTYCSIQHLGSTSVPGLASKPIIDLYISVLSIEEAKILIPIIETLGYRFWKDCPNKDRLWFGKGIPPFGLKRTHHLHVMQENSDLLQSRVVFRDILRNNIKVKNAYNALKIRLSKLYAHDRELYTDKKFDFILGTLKDAGYTGFISR